MIRSISGKFIAFIGPLGVGKSTIAQALAKKLKADFIIKEPHRENPFWEKSQKNPKFMFRSQIYFLISNILSDIKARSKPGISVSDTSTLTDILMWASWYHQIGHLSDAEYKKYKKLVALLKPIIPRPNFLVALIPDSIENLVQGIKQRCQNEPWRKGELVFTKKHLALEIKRVKKLTKEITKTWKISVLILTVNPIKIHKEAIYRNTIIGQIIREILLN
jgi:deoxyadenosine/deoxycytidine kinase